MMMITRTASMIEFGSAESQTIRIDVERITGAMLAAERAPCGRIFHTLILSTGPGIDPIRIEGAPIELTEVHQYVIETMLSIRTPAEVTLASTYH